MTETKKCLIPIPYYKKMDSLWRSWNPLAELVKNCVPMERDGHDELQPSEMEAPDIKRGRVIQMIERGYCFERECK